MLLSKLCSRRYRLGVGLSTAAIALASALGIRIRDFAPREFTVGVEGEDWATGKSSDA